MIQHLHARQGGDQLRQACGGKTFDFLAAGQTGAGGHFADALGQPRSGDDHFLKLYHIPRRRRLSGGNAELKERQREKGKEQAHSDSPGLEMKTAPWHKRAVSK